VDDSVTSEVQALFERFMGYYNAKDVDALVSLTSGDDIMLVGTGADEVRFGLTGFRAQAERDFSQADDLDISFDNLRVTSAGDAAFAYCDMTIAGSAGGEAFEMSGLRFTAGLIRTTQGWRIAQAHLSAPNMEQAEGSSF
jgi:ketosteroid isomerase-like protein